MLLFVHPYLRGFLSVAHRLLPLLCVVFFLGVVWCDLGAGVNIPALVWHADPLLQIAAGFSVTALFAHVWLVTYILDTRFHAGFIRDALERDGRSLAFRAVLWLLPRAHGTAADPDDLREGGDGLRWYLGVTFLPCTLLLLLPVFFVVDTTAPFVHFTDPDSVPADRPYVVERWPFAVGIVLAVLAIRAATWAGGWFLRRWLTTERRKQLIRTSWLHGVAGLTFVVLAVSYIVTAVLVRYEAWQPPPVTAACLLLGVLIGAGGAVWFHLRYWALLVFALLGGWVYYCNLPDYKIRFPYLADEYGRVADLRAYEEPAVRLDDVVDDPADAATADRAKADEIKRVSDLIAARRAQAHESVARAETVHDLSARGLTTPGKYADLRGEYQKALDRLRDEEKAALVRWRSQFPRNRNPILVLVTATGGANRSALWTATVLDELHRTPEFKDFPKHVRVIAGASGGMVGAAYYVGSLHPGGVLPEGFRPKDVAQDFLTPIINGLAFREVPFLAVPTTYYARDRGEMLDLAMEGAALHVPEEVDEIRRPGGGVERRVVPGDGVRARLRSVFTKTFADLRAGEEEGWRPSLIFSPMIVEDGRRLFISNRHVPFLTVNRGEFLLPNGPDFGAAVPTSVGEGSRKLKAAQTKPGTARQRRPRAAEDQDVYSRPGVEFFALFPEARDRFRLSTAARMNATFPFLSPAVSLPTAPVRRVVDAGYYDNTGVSVAAAWLYRHADTVIDLCSGVVVIQIRDSTSHRENRTVSLPAAGEASLVPTLAGVLAAVSHARTASASYRNDDDLQALGDYFRMYATRDQFFTTAVFERYGDVGMSWYLSPADKKDILDSWDTGDGNMNPASLEKLKKWWADHSR